MVYGAIGGLVGLILAYALWEPYRIQTTEYTVAIDNLAPAFEGATILHLSDLHGRVGVFSFRPFLRWLAEADMVVVTGDLYSPTLPRARLARHLERLSAPLGVYYVSGNHDYRRGRLAVEPWDPGGRIIDNRVITIRRDGQTLFLAGLPDLVKGKPEWEAVRACIDAASGPVILLAHRPDAWLLPGVERAGLILAGHTHGGQIRIPGYGALIRHTRLLGRYTSGRLEQPGRPVLITSRGLGTSELPLRFLAPPEIIRVRLVSRHRMEDNSDRGGE
ncbi:MAG: metallophosphoesterase [Thermaerobacter sp.]|nr:metallophosphoesterase [Thermaerobacter sp.]